MQAVVTVPDRTLEQRFDALARANEIRSYRAALKDDLRWCRRSVLDVLESDDPRLATMKVYELLLAVPKVGRVKASRWLARASVSPSKTVGGLSPRQRVELRAVLPGR